MPRREPERGAATVLVVAATGLVLVLLVGGLALASAVVATHRARAAADLAALAAAQALQAGADPRTACAAADRMTVKNGAHPGGCFAAVDGTVTCRATTSPTFTLPGTSPRTTTASARAGPSP
jgi:secretion/DNA translocation related TadE-like protein